MVQWERIHLSVQETQEMRVDASFGKIPWRRKRQPTPVFLSGESHGRRSLAGFSPQDCTELDTAEHIELTIKMNVYIITAVTTVIALCSKIQEKKRLFLTIHLS